MISRLVFASVTAAVLWACTGSGEPSFTTVATASTTTETTAATTIPAPKTVEAGRLVIIEEDGAIAVIEPDGSGRIALTGAAGGSIYTQPIWSPDSSRIAFGEISEDGFMVRVEDLDEVSGVSIPVSNNPFFMFWSPSSERLGVLHTGSQGLDFEVADASEGAIEVLDRGSPFYFSWSPDGEQVAVHVGPDRFEALDLSGGSTPLGETSPGYLAPQWLPEGILHAVDGHLVIGAGEDSVSLAEVGEQVMFVANEDGSLVALQSLGPAARTVSFAESTAVEPNVVSVLNTRSLEIEVVDAEPAVGMWWSPDGRSLLVLTPAGDGSSVTAKVWSGDDGLVEHVTYRPSPIQVRDVFPFFPQYAQSMTVWAPDSSGFAVVGEIEDEAGVWIQALGASEPTLVSDGLWVAWSRGD